MKQPRVNPLNITSTSRWFHYPLPTEAESNRWANLRGESGTDWDYGAQGDRNYLPDTCTSATKCKRLSV